MQKFLSQAHAFDELGAQVDCIGYDRNSVVVSHYKNGRFQCEEIIAILKNIKSRRFSLWLGVRNYIKTQKYDLAYIRYPLIDFIVLRTLRSVRKSCSKVVIEIPSYPLEIKNITTIHKGLYILDHVLHNNCAKLVDKILYVGSKVDSIFGCVAEQIPNGLPEQIKQIPSTGYRFEGNRIVLICVSRMNFFHGYDRLLNGLAEHYKKKNDYVVDVVLVGDGFCRKEYERIVETNGLIEHVKFTGLLKGDALTDEYRNATIGISTLGLYRKGFTEASSLKTKEYLVRGLPFVYAGNEIGLDDSFPYALKMPNDASVISIDKIVDFANRIKVESAELVKEKMKAYAEEKYSWKRILQKACGEYLN